METEGQVRQRLQPEGHPGHCVVNTVASECIKDASDGKGQVATPLVLLSLRLLL